MTHVDKSQRNTGGVGAHDQVALAGDIANADVGRIVSIFSLEFGPAAVVPAADSGSGCGVRPVEKRNSEKRRLEVVARVGLMLDVLPRIVSGEGRTRVVHRARDEQTESEEGQHHNDKDAGTPKGGSERRIGRQKEPAG